MRPKHVMLDHETLDNCASSVIISIGAVRFDPDTDQIDDDAYYASVSVDSNLESGRTISESTLIWWMQQSEDAQAVFMEPKQTLESALIGFVDWFDDAEFIWSNGASFDIPQMSSALKGLGMLAPWKFYNERCVRTLKNLPGMRDVKVDNPLKHNAMQDALAQAKLVQAIYRKLNAAHAHPMIKPKKVPA